MAGGSQCCGGSGNGAGAGCCGGGVPLGVPARFATQGVALTSLKPGETARICETCLDPADAAMLRAMGLRPNAVVRLCRMGEPCIVEVMAGEASASGCACRIGLAKLLAQRVLVVGKENGHAVK